MICQKRINKSENVRMPKNVNVLILKNKIVISSPSIKEIASYYNLQSTG